MNSHPMPPQETDPVTEIYRLLSGLNLKDKWKLALTMLAGVLEFQDEFTQHRLIAELPADLRASIHRLKEIQTEIQGRLQ